MAALVVGAGAIIWTFLTPDPTDLNGLLAVLWTLIAARGLFMALSTLRRVRREHARAKADGDPELMLIADGNVRRYAILSGVLGAFLIIGVAVLTGQNNVSVSRALIVISLMLIGGLVELDAAEIEKFDALSNDRPEPKQPIPFTERTQSDAPVHDQ